MQSYFVSYVKEDKTGIGFAYRVFEQFKKITADTVDDLKTFLSEYENGNTIIILNIINITNGI